MCTGEARQGDRDDQPDQPARRSGEPSELGPLDILGDSRGLQAIYGAIERAAGRFGHGRWRVVSDALDEALKVVVDVAMKRGAASPRNWPAFAVEIYRNLVRKGPPRGPMDARRTINWPEVEMIAPDPEDAPLPRELDLASLPMHLLTEAESRALRAYFELGSVARSAEHVAMTRRDLRVRLRRATKKIRCSVR